MSAPIRSGTNLAVRTRLLIAAVDATHPNSSNPTAANTWRQPNARSRDAHVSVFTGAAQAGVSITVTLYVSKDGTGAQATAGSWRRYGQLNAGAPITPTAPPGGTTHTNRVAYVEAVPGLAGWPYVYAEITGTIAADNTNLELIAEDE